MARRARPEIAQACAIAARERTPAKRTAHPEADRLAQEALARRQDAYAALLTEEGWRAFLRARLLHSYSWRNCALIAAQAPDALRLATFAQWAKYGAHVQPRQTHVAKICVKTARGFGTCSLFDVTQTDAVQDIEEADIFPPGFDNALQALSQAAERPRAPEEVSGAGEAIDRAHKRAEGTTA